jgi:N-acetylglucosaminyl-diphospho-decaprenol L-rhamnosyltransferase
MEIPGGGTAAHERSNMPPELLPETAVVIVNYRTPELAVSCAQSAELARPSFTKLHVIIVDGCSGDGSSEAIANMLAAAPHSDTQLLALEVNGGFAFANNRAILHLTGQGIAPAFVALINPDARLRPGALELMAVQLTAGSDCGAVGARLEHEDGMRQSSAFNFPSLRGEFCRGARTGVIDKLLRAPPIAVDLDQAGEVPWVAGTAVILRAAALEQCGLFDEGFFLYFEETELMHRIRRQGWRIWHEPAARVVHLGGMATKIRDPETGLPRRGEPMPRYWYESRRRYFALVGGRGFALASSVAWLGGRVIWLTRRLIQRKPDDGARRMTRDFLRYAFLPRWRDGVPAALRANALPPSKPAWQRGVR